MIRERKGFDDLVRQYGLAREIQAERLRVAAAQKRATDLRSEIAARRQDGAAAASALDSLAQAVDLAAGPPAHAQGEEFFEMGEIAPTSLRRLSTSLASLQAAVESADAAPTPDARTGFVERKKLVESGLARWGDVLAVAKPKADEALRRAGLAPLKPE